MVVETKILQSNVKIKVEIKVDLNDTSINFGKVFVFNDNLKKFNKLFEVNIDALFGAKSTPEGETDDGLLNIIAEASDKLISNAILIIE